MSERTQEKRDADLEAVIQELRKVWPAIGPRNQHGLLAIFSAAVILAVRAPEQFHEAAVFVPALALPFAVKRDA